MSFNIRDFSVEVIANMISYMDHKLAINFIKAFNSKKMNIDISELKKYCNLHINFKNNFINRLTDVGINNTNKFIDILKNTNSIIAGSLILQVILYEQWENSDMDIFTFNSDKVINQIIKIMPIEQYKIVELSKGYYGEDDITTNDLTNMIKKQVNSTKSRLKLYRNKKLDKGPIKIGHVKTMNYDGIKIQIICLNRLTNNIDILDSEQQLNLLKKFVYDTFDFDFCKNIYDGTNLYIYDKSSIINKCTSISNIQVPTTTLARIVKYSKRGFTILDVDKYHHKFLSADAHNKKMMEMNQSFKQRLYGRTYEVYIAYYEKSIYVSHHAHYLRNIFTELEIDDIKCNAKCNDHGADNIRNYNIGREQDINNFYNNNYISHNNRTNIFSLKIIFYNIPNIENFDNEFIDLSNNIILSLNKSKQELNNIISNWINKMLLKIIDNVGSVFMPLNKELQTNPIYKYKTFDGLQEIHTNLYKQQ